jgi:hypothetical protein
MIHVVTQLSNTVLGLAQKVDAMSMHQPRIQIPRISLQLPKYNGKGDWTAFAAQFSNVTRQSQWTDTQKAEMLGCALEGDAQVMYSRLPERDRYNYPWLWDRLRSRYGESLPEVRREELNSRTRLPGEPIAQLRDEIWRMAQEAYPDLEYPLQERLALDALKRAVGKELRLRFLDQGVQSLQQAVQVTEIYESILGRSTSSHNVKSVRATSNLFRNHMGI